MYQYFQIVLKPIKRLPKLENKFIFMVLVIKTIQVMKIKLMLIHQAKVKKGYILVFYMARIVNPQSKTVIQNLG